MNVGDLLQLLWSGLSFILILSVLVAVHEYGHFWFARLFGMRVSAFAVFVGGKRVKGVVEAHRQGSLVPSAVLWGIGAILIAVMTIVRHPIAYYGAFVGLAAVLPAWTASRIGSLYHYSIQRTANIALMPVLFATGLILFVAKQPSAKLAILMVAAWVAVMLTYYQPVMAKDEDEPTQGIGAIEVDGQPVEVPFRPLLCRSDRKGTEYSLLLLPLGGFARIEGMVPKEDGSEWHEEGGYFSKGPFARFMVIFAGPLFSFLLGSVLLTGAIYGKGKPEMTKEPILGTVTKDGAAAEAGLKAGDRILSVDGKPIAKFFDSVLSIRDSGGKTVSIVVDRDGKQMTFSVTPKLDKAPTPVLDADWKPTKETRLQSKIGVAPKINYLPIAFSEAAIIGLKAPAVLVGNLLLTLVTKPSEVSEGVGGITQVAAATHDAAKDGIYSLLELAGGLSISLGFMNLLPIYPLDGGRMLFTIIEALRGNKRIDLKIQHTLSTVGVMLIVLLFIAATTMDISRLAK